LNVNLGVERKEDSWWIRGVVRLCNDPADRRDVADADVGNAMERVGEDGNLIARNWTELHVAMSGQRAEMQIAVLGLDLRQARHAADAHQHRWVDQPIAEHDREGGRPSHDLRLVAVFVEHRYGFLDR
jgi:hypothetical protein